MLKIEHFLLNPSYFNQIMKYDLKSKQNHH